MALTLVEAAKRMTGETLRPAIVETFARENDILRVLPFENISGSAYKFNREGALGTVAFRGVNEGFTPNEGSLDPITEALAIAGGELDVDDFIVETHGPATRTTYEMMKVKALAQTIGHKFVKGSSTTDPKEFDGFQVRATGAQLIANGASSGGDVLSMAKLDELIDSVASPTHLIMSRAMRRTVTAAARLTTVGGFVSWTKDEFGRQIQAYNDLPILIADGIADVNATLAFDEANPGGGSSVGTSIYCASFRDGGLVGLQSKPMEVEDLGKLQSAPLFRTRIQWFVTIALLDPRALGRLYGIKAGAAAV